MPPDETWAYEMLLYVRRNPGCSARQVAEEVLGDGEARTRQRNLTDVALRVMRQLGLVAADPVLREHPDGKGGPWPHRTYRAGPMVLHEEGAEHV